MTPAGTPLRVLDNAAVRAAGGLDPVAALSDLRAALALWREGAAEMPPETSVALDGGPAARAYALPGRLGGAVERAAVKWTAHRQPLRDGLPTVMSLTVVTDTATGLPLGLVESAPLTATRAAAASALALLHAAPAVVRRVALLGAGAQAAAHLRMLAAVFPGLDAVTVWNRTPARIPAMLAGPALPWPVSVAQTPGAAVAGADAVLCCTAATRPLLDATAMRPGRIVLQVGYNEVSFDAIDQADAVVVDLWGEFRLTSAKSLFQMHRAGRFPASRVAADLPALVLDGWRPARGSCVYFSSFGLTLFDIALASRVLSDASALGLGTVMTLGLP